MRINAALDMTTYAVNEMQEVTVMYWNRIIKGWITLILTLSVLCLMSSPVQAFTEMTDEELSQVTGTGFSSFTLQNDVARAYFNIQASTFTEIQSLKMGYTNGGWDQDWTKVSLGSSTQDLVCKGFYIEAKFSNISDASTRTLDYLKVGTPAMTGPITANFNSFSGHIGNGTATGGADYYRANLSRSTITSNNDEFYLQLNRTGAQTGYAGWWVFFKNATVSPAP